MAIKKGDKVKIDYTGTFDDGVVFDSSEQHGSPLEFESGAGHIIRGLDRQIDGMELGEEKQVRIEPKEAYGDRNPELVQSIPKDKLPMKVEAGQMIMLGDQQGNRFPAVIAEVTTELVKIDLNHPLAGKPLNFKVKVVGID
jgi:FKBP-type peptidyl-prolyl cis-trans isomerase 2